MDNRRRRQTLLVRLTRPASLTHRTRLTRPASLTHQTHRTHPASLTRPASLTHRRRLVVMATASPDMAVRTATNRTSLIKDKPDKGGKHR